MLDLYLSLELAKTLPFFCRLDRKDQVKTQLASINGFIRATTVLTHVILCLGTSSEAYSNCEHYGW